MFGIGSGELFLIFIVAVLVLGPEHLPRIIRTTQTIMSTFRKVSTEFQRTLNLEDVLQQNDSKSTTKRPTTTTKKKKKTTTAGKSTTKKSSKTATKNTTGKKTSSVKAEPASKDTTKKKTVSNHTSDASATASAPNTTKRDTPATQNSVPEPSGQGQTPSSSPADTPSATPQNLGSQDTKEQEPTTYPRPTEYITVSPKSQSQHHDIEENIPPVSSAPSVSKPLQESPAVTPANPPIPPAGPKKEASQGAFSDAEKTSDTTATTDDRAKGDV